MFGFGKRDEKSEDDMYSTSVSAARRQQGDESAVVSRGQTAQFSSSAAPSQSTQRVALQAPPSLGGGIPAHMDDSQKIIVG